MRRTSVLFLAAVAAALLSRPAWAADKTEAKDDQGAEAVKKANRSLSEAILKGDGKDFDELTTDDYLLTSSTGKLWDKKKNLDALKEGTLAFDKMDDSDVKVHVYGDAAVVTGLSSIKGKYKDRTFNDEYRWTRVFVHHDGGWKCAAEQMSRVWSPEEIEKDKEKPKDK